MSPRLHLDRALVVSASVDADTPKPGVQQGGGAEGPSLDGDGRSYHLVHPVGVER